MADRLGKVERMGSTRPLQYAVRDIRGVEAPAATPPDRTGFNEEADWSGRADAALDREHLPNGFHGGLKFPFAIVFLRTGANDQGDRVWLDVAGESWREGALQADAPFVHQTSVYDLVLEFNDALPGLVTVQVEGLGCVGFKRPNDRTVQLDIAPGFVVAHDNGGHCVLAFYGE